jgi:hypothetical protein
VIQEDATSACVSVGLSQTFGLVGVKNHYTANGEKVSGAVLEEALRGLYSPEIRSGMSEAVGHLNEVCNTGASGKIGGVIRSDGQIWQS